MGGGRSELEWSFPLIQKRPQQKTEVRDNNVGGTQLQIPKKFSKPFTFGEKDDVETKIRYIKLAFTIFSGVIYFPFWDCPPHPRLDAPVSVLMKTRRP